MSRLRPWLRQRIRAFRMRDESTLREIETYSEPVGAILLDTYHKDMLGGSGETFDWSLAARAKALTDRPIILAGGLTPENVQDALEAVRPYGVDVSSASKLRRASKTMPKSRRLCGPCGNGICGRESSHVHIFRESNTNPRAAYSTAPYHPGAV